MATRYFAREFVVFTTGFAGALYCVPSELGQGNYIADREAE